MEKITAKTPWEPWMGQVPMHLEYFEGSMFDAVKKIAEQYPQNIAFDFQGQSTTYPDMIRQIEQCAKALKALGVREGDKVTIAMPNCPQAVFLFYGVNRIGAIANMIHPLSAEKEIEFYLNVSESETAITLNMFYQKFANILPNTRVKHLVIASIADALSPVMKLGFAVKNVIDPIIKAVKKHTKPQFQKKVPRTPTRWCCGRTSWRGRRR
jgi:long-chain acyl-CoA synthetase